MAGSLSLNFPGYSGIYSKAGQYTLVTATGALSGSFSSTTVTGLSGTGNHLGAVTYDAHDVYIDLVRDTFVWNATPVSGNFSTNANWQNGAVPGFMDIAYFGATNRTQVTISPFGSAFEAVQLNSGAPAYSFVIADPASTSVPANYIPPPPCTGTCFVSGTGEVVQIAAGIINNSSYSPTFIVGGVFEPSVLNFTSSGNVADANITAAAYGTVDFQGNADAGGAAKLSAQNLGTFDFSSTIGAGGDNKVSAGSIAGAGTFIIGANNFTVGDLNTSTEVSGEISGAGGSLTKVGNGTLTISGSTSYTGGTIVSAGTLQIGNGGTGGSVLGDIDNDAILTFQHSDNITFAGVISGSGTVRQGGSGTLTLSGGNTYTGPTTISAGTLNITGAVGSSPVTVQSGAILTGTGKVGPLTVAGAGTLTPGSSTSSGTLSVIGDLALSSGSTFLDVVTPTTAGLVIVNGAAKIDGNVIAVMNSGTYMAGQRYTLLTAAGGVSGTFASLGGMPPYINGRLSYDTNDVYLNLDPNLLTSPTDTASDQSGGILPSTSVSNGVVPAVNAAVTAGAIPSGGFQALYGLSGPELSGATKQISGQIGPNVSTAIGQSFLSFLSMTSDGGKSSFGNFGPDSAYGALDSPQPAQLSNGTPRLWGAAYGGHVGLSGNAGGAAGLSASNLGLIAGAELQLTNDLLAGISLGLGRQLLNSGNGTGDSDDFTIGLYSRTTVIQGYVSASLGYGWNHITTIRDVTVSGNDVLQGKQNANDYGGRIEAGWQFVLNNGYSFIPYSALVGERFESPGYKEIAISGTSTFALSNSSQGNSVAQTELGARLSHNFEIEGSTLTGDLLAGWAHQLGNAPFTTATFQGLPGAVFQTLGARPNDNTALLGLSVEIQNSSGLFFGVRGESQVGIGTTIMEGMGNLGWRW